ncbi:MAG: adenosylcobinamide-GDP ribazoletransferase [Acidimicrobiales bacterium]
MPEGSGDNTPSGSGLAGAVCLLTVFGRGRPLAPSLLGWLATVGSVMGLALGLLWWGAQRIWPPLVAAAVVVAADLVLTGMLHFDGLVDSADGLIAPMNRSRRLEVMADPAAGAFGVVAAVAVVVLRVTALAAMVASPLVLGLLWGSSRAAMAGVNLWGRSARPGGMADSLVARSTGENRGWSRARVGVVAGVIVPPGLVAGWSAAAGPAWPVAAGVAVTVAGVVAVYGLARRRIGGFTGDVLGAAGVVGESFGLVAMAARW